jgi:hypothetical protein
MRVARKFTHVLRTVVTCALTHICTNEELFQFQEIIQYEVLALLASRRTLILYSELKMFLWFLWNKINTETASSETELQICSELLCAYRPRFVGKASDL